VAAAAAAQQPHATSLLGVPGLGSAASHASAPAPVPGLELPPLGAVATSTPTPYRGARTPFPLPLGADHLGAKESLGQRTHRDEERRCCEWCQTCTQCQAARPALLVAC
jgi:hypothetical protein